MNNLSNMNNPCNPNLPDMNIRRHHGRIGPTGTRAALALAAMLCASPAPGMEAPARKPAAQEAAQPLRSSRPLATWVWDWWDHQQPMEGDYFEDYAGDLLGFCESKNIKTLYLGVAFPIPEARVGVTEQLLERAHARGIRVEASATSQRGDDIASVFMSGVLDWNRARPAARRFDGAHFDHEEYTGTWLDAAREIWQGETLAELKKIDPEFKLGLVGIPALWWGQGLRRQEYGFRLQDYSDYVSIMSYFQGDVTRDFFTGPSKPAIDYAAKTGKKVEIGFEVSPWPGEGNYWTGWEYMTFFPQGEAELIRRVEQINSAFAGHAGFGGVVIQSSDAYQRMHMITEDMAKTRRLHGKADAAAEPLPGGTKPVEIAGFTAPEPHHSAEDPGMKTRLATFDISPPLQPGEVLVFDARFGEYHDIRPNPLTDEWVPAEVFWFGFADPDPFYRFLRMDFNGGLGMRSIGMSTPSDPRISYGYLIRVSHDRFTPEPGRTYEGRLYFFADSRVLLKIIDPTTDKVVWHSDRMPCDRGQLGRMYVEALDKAPWGTIVHDEANRAIRFPKGDKEFATIGNLRRATLPAAGQ